MSAERFASQRISEDTGYIHNAIIKIRNWKVISLDVAFFNHIERGNIAVSWRELDKSLSSPTDAIPLHREIDILLGWNESSRVFEITTGCIIDERETDNEGIIRFSRRLYPVIGCSRFTSSESLLLRREARANLRPSAATILSPMWRSPTRRGRVSDVTLKRNETSAIFPADPPLEHRIFSSPLKTEDFVIRKSAVAD